jgi:hypothetical protein
MAEVVYMPWKKIVVHEIQEIDVASFLQFVAASFEGQKQVGVPVVQWGEGIAFIRADFPDTPEVISEKLKGTLHVGIVNFARTNFQEQKKTTFNGREYAVRLAKVEKNPDLVNLCKFLVNFTGRESSESAESTTKRAFKSPDSASVLAP